MKRNPNHIISSIKSHRKIIFFTISTFFLMPCALLSPIIMIRDYYIDKQEIVWQNKNHIQIGDDIEESVRKMSCCLLLDDTIIQENNHCYKITFDVRYYAYPPTVYDPFPGYDPFDSPHLEMEYDIITNKILLLW